MEFNLDNLVRETIKDLAPYSTARHEFSGEAKVMLDANENAAGSPVTLDINERHEQLNRYPDPIQLKLKERISNIKRIPVDHIFTGNGSDEAIDLLIRIFCEPGFDNIITLPPTYGMYSVAAAINNIKVKEVALDADFQLNIQGIADAIDDYTKIIFICSPNNPSGNSIIRQDIEIILNNFDGIVVVDEAYINYARQKTLSLQLMDYPNLVVLQTLSKAWGLAALRLGMAFAGKEIIRLMNNVKYPYNINIATQELALKALQNVEQVNGWIRDTIAQRELLADALKQMDITRKVYPSDANFLLVQMTGANEIFGYLQQKGIIVRNRSNVPGCEDCLRITIGTEEENHILIEALKAYCEK
ncbi:histidinol-phosphate transaminase [Niabella ginsenosidivorans]|uniref:Histidinol-phosphate aminotransferase n=1 Tax=Niabella ginsenosidivorans TaxID=1176587 RepID=A0A1A9I4Z0_9BACT|nr:histidinol-phosphate transaminase [Niabella ginsenosidivorans]ANH82119.1 histidinol-phosphate transaminase [Niabella ginsenosidivorans]